VGVNLISSRFLLFAKQQGVDFSRTALLGRQHMNVGTQELFDNLLEFNDLATYADASAMKTTGWADEFFRHLGARTLTSFDMCKYENADVEHDMNVPIRDDQVGQFTAVVDAGTLEHVFNLPQAMANCMRMIADGGWFVGVMPSNNVAGHGFYQFSPELLFRVFDRENGFRVASMWLAEQNDDPPYGYASWRQIMDPAEAGHRMEFRTVLQTCVMVLAQKMETVPLFSRGVQQSDYVTAWGGRR
jgi:hypothetical protein